MCILRECAHSWSLGLLRVWMKSLTHCLVTTPLCLYKRVHVQYMPTKRKCIALHTHMNWTNAYNVNTFTFHLLITLICVCTCWMTPHEWHQESYLLHTYVPAFFSFRSLCFYTRVIMTVMFMLHKISSLFALLFFSAYAGIIF